MPSANTTAELVATVGFGGPDTVFGAIWCGSRAAALLDGQLVELSTAGLDEDGIWTLTGEGVQLRVAPGQPGDGEPGDGEPGQPGDREPGDREPGDREPVDGEPDLGMQRCRVSGEVQRQGRRVEVDATGVRCRRMLDDLREIDSLRHVCAWFPAGIALALDAVRPAGARGHDRDVVSVALLERAGPTAIEEGRLSVTYRDSERPTRVGLELWPAGAEEETFPRRLAGELDGVGATASLGELELWLGPLRTHHAGQEGAGALILARRLR